MEFEYTNKLIEIIKEAETTNSVAIKEAAKKFAECIENDHIIYCFGTGHSHMVGIELYSRAGGLANVQAMLDADAITSNGVNRSGKIERLCGLADIIYEDYPISKGDIMLITSNSGRNAVPIEMAMRCKKEGIYTIALTNLKQSQNTTSRHPSGKRLFELCDLVLDSCVPNGDASLNIEGTPVGAASTAVTCYIVDTIVTEAVRIVKKDGKKAYVYQSQNIDGYNNEECAKHFEHRIKGL